MLDRSRSDRVSEAYCPSKADLEYRNFVDAKNPFARAKLLRHVSHEYLAVLAQDNTSPNSAGMKAMIDAELSRRGFASARLANKIAFASAAIALLSLFISVFK